MVTARIYLPDWIRDKNPGYHDAKGLDHWHYESTTSSYAPDVNASNK